MIAIVIASVVYVTFFSVVELVSRRLHIPKEASRKFIHITTGISVACLPLVMSRLEIIILASLFCVVMLVSRSLGIFSSIHDVTRRTYGELFFPLAVLLCAIILRNNFVYAYGLLVMAVADGMASLIGTRFGKKKYSLLGAKKSYIGSATFFGSAIVCGLIICLLGHFGHRQVLATIAVAGICTIVEASLSLGLDNIVIPLLAGLMFKFLGGL